MHMIARQLRTMQFEAQAQHQQITGATFPQDHKLLDDLYHQYADSYDKVMERMITYGYSGDPRAITADAAEEVQSISRPDTIVKGLDRLHTQEDALRKMLAEEAEGAPLGINNLLATLAEEQDLRLFTLRGRLGK